MRLIYIAGPYRSSTEYGIACNIQRAEDAAIKFWRQGFAVICPHKNTAFLGGVVSDDTFLQGCFEILKRCDGIYMLKGWEQSLGAYEEHRIARQLGLEIIYEDNGDNIDLTRNS